MTTYSARVIRKVENRPGTWNSIEVGVFRSDGEAEEQVGAYFRNYPNLFSTFCHFRQDGRDYALYSRDYTASRIMALPSCEDVGGEDVNAWGFCPVDYYVPRYIEHEYIDLEDVPHRLRVNEPSAEDLIAGTTKYTPLDKKTGKRIVVEKPYYPVTELFYYAFGFVAGCIWGDDGSWKIQYLDLSEVQKGVIKRDERFGYIALPDELSLRQAVRMDDYDPTDPHGDRITIAVQKRFELQTGKVIDENPFA